MGKQEGSAETDGHLERGGYIVRVLNRLYIGSTGSNPLMMDLKSRSFVRFLHAGLCCYALVCVGNS